MPFDNEHEIRIADNDEILAVPFDSPIEHFFPIVNDATSWGFESSDDEDELFQNILPPNNISGQLHKTGLALCHQKISFLLIVNLIHIHSLKLLILPTV